VSVLVIGLNHRTAPLPLLERMTVSQADLAKALHDLAGRPNLSEATVLSTCNRTEVYAVAERFHGAFADVRDFLATMAGLNPEDFADHLYVHYDEAAVSHLFSVAAGLDSAVVGESEILGQVGGAWRQAQQEGAARTGLNLLFRHALEVGKRARNETGIGRHTASVSHAAVAMASARLPGGLSGRRVLVLGAGTMGDGMTVALRKAGVGELLVVNRTWEAAVGLARRSNGRPIPLAELDDALVGTDVLLTSTGATSILVERAELASVMGRRGGRPLLIVDVAMPRDVDPSVAQLDGVTLLDMDNLRAFASEGMASRRREIGRVQEIVEEELDRFRSVSTAREVAPLVSALYDRAESVRQAELARHNGRLAGLEPDQLEAVESLSRGIVAKLLHEPTVRLKSAAGSLQGERLAEALRDLFGIGET
jgi:glutamyl-tRNA reductase